MQFLLALPALLAPFNAHHGLAAIVPSLIRHYTLDIVNGPLAPEGFNRISERSEFPWTAKKGDPLRVLVNNKLASQYFILSIGVFDFDGVFIDTDNIFNESFPFVTSVDSLYIPVRPIELRLISPGLAHLAPVPLTHTKFLCAHSTLAQNLFSFFFSQGAIKPDRSAALDTRHSNLLSTVEQMYKLQYELILGQKMLCEWRSGGDKAIVWSLFGTDFGRMGQ
ncbi:hypothetical protein DFH09DRAFT_1277290 [Mycena vulgaris]|nr:hypothetical protein DFH09DRAFT_1277290 [Mycena vulgaris]